MNISLDGVLHTETGMYYDVEVDTYIPAVESKITGEGYGDVSPPEPAELEYTVYEMDSTEVVDVVYPTDELVTLIEEQLDE